MDFVLAVIAIAFSGVKEKIQIADAIKKKEEHDEKWAQIAREYDEAHKYDYL